MKVIRLGEVETISFGPGAVYQPLVGDDGAPLRTGIQTSQPGYATPVHSHPYLEVLFVLEGAADAWVEGEPQRTMRVVAGDTLVIPPDVSHGFRVVGDAALRTLGIHASPRRIVNYQDPQHRADGRGYPIAEGRA